MPSGAMTLLELAKTMPKGPERDIIGTYALAYQPLTAMPMPEAVGGSWKWDLEYQLPHTTGGARNINGTHSATRAAVSPFAEHVRIYGGRVQIDRALEDLNPGRVAYEKIAQIKAKAYNVTVDMFQGANGTYLRGIKDWLDNATEFANQTFDVGSSSAGTALMTDHLDRLLSMLNVIPGQTFIYTTKNIGLRAAKLSRGNNATNDVAFANRYAPEQWGDSPDNYRGIPIVPLVDGKGNSMLSTDEGDGSSSAVYGVTYGMDNFTGFQTGGVRIYNNNDSTSYDYFDIDHKMGTAPQSIMCIARLRYVAETV